MNIVLCSSSENPELLLYFFGTVGILHNIAITTQNILFVFYKTRNVSNDFFING